jgi:hypothetical protein
LSGAAPLRVAAGADGKREAGLRIVPVVGKTTTAALVLSAATPDRDGDGVPDAIDDCPDTPDPGQANARGTGPGDACVGGVDLGSRVDLANLGPQTDLGPRVDLANLDLAHVAGLCPIAGTTLCEDWRVPFPTNTAWSFDTSTPPPKVSAACDGTKYFYGTAALHMHVDPFSSAGYVQADIGAGTLPSGAFWVRVYVFLPSLNPPHGSDLVSLLDYGHAYASWFLSMSDGWALEFGDNVASPSLSKTSATQLPMDRWFCLEWQVNQVATLGMSSSRVYLDGTEVTDLATSNDSAYPGDPNRVILSSDFSGATPLPNGSDVWFTQIAVGPNRIGCISP